MFKPWMNNRGEVEGGGTPPAITFDAVNALQGDAFRGLLPEDVRGQGYMKDINTFGDFVKKFDGAQKLIGSREVPDAATGTPEQWAAFFKKAGQPDSPDGYQIPEVQGVPKEYLEKASELKDLKNMMHAAGLNSVQAKAFVNMFVKTIYDAEQKEAKDADLAYQNFINTTFGKDKDAILANGKAVLAAHAPESVKAFINDLDDKSLGIVLALADGIAKKFGGEDTFRGGQGAGGGAPLMTAATIQSEMTKIMAQKEYRDPFLNKPKHEELKGQMEKLRTKLRELSGGK
jgi:hypothetical protein